MFRNEYGAPNPCRLSIMVKIVEQFGIFRPTQGATCGDCCRPSEGKLEYASWWVYVELLWIAFELCALLDKLESAWINALIRCSSASSISG